MNFFLALAFAVTAAVYASAGFGGGSSYTALLAASGVDAAVLPIVSLACNILVVAGATWRHAACGNVPWQGVVPLAACSVPMAWIGGRLPVGEEVFLTLLGIALLLAALLMFFQPAEQRRPRPKHPPRGVLFATGGAVGLLSGLVGIGGGIFLAPLMYLVAWDTPRRIAAAASVFILVNSFAGIAGQLAKGGGERALEAVSFWPLAIAVIIGGQIGARLAAGRLPERQIRRLTGVIVLIVALRLIWGVLRRNVVGS
ncbi:MAG: sulfite exporter TauE/SafE family protein [Pseudomonadota bacterium]